MDFAERAVDPRQYDHRVGWSDERNRPPAIQRAVFAMIPTYLKAARGQYVLDVGCGSGWLGNAFAQKCAHVTGIEPSEKLTSLARTKFPAIDFYQTTLADFQPSRLFDLVLCIMVIEHFSSLDLAFSKLRALIKNSGKVVVLCPSYDLSPYSRGGFKVDTVESEPGVAAVRVDRKENGTLYNLIRTPERIIREAHSAELTLLRHRKIHAKEHPDYKPGQDDRIILYLFEFAAST